MGGETRAPAGGSRSPRPAKGAARLRQPRLRRAGGVKRPRSPVGFLPAGRGLSAWRRQLLPLGSAPLSAPEPLQREDGDGGRERRAGLWRTGGLGGHGSGNRLGESRGGVRPSRGEEGFPWGWDEAALRDLPPPLCPSALLLPRGGTGLACDRPAGEPRPAPGENREGRGVSLSADLPLPLHGVGGFPPLIVPSRCSGAGSAWGSGEGAQRGGSAPRSRLSHPPPAFPPLARASAAAPRFSGRAEVVTAAGALGAVRPGRGWGKR